MKKIYIVCLWICWIGFGALVAQNRPEPQNLDSVYAQIRYPAVAKDAEIEGKVYLRVLVNKDGSYLRHEVMRSPHEVLTRAVEAHIAELVCDVGYKDGVPVKYWITLPFKFELRK